MGRLALSIARHHGLQPQDAEDLLQETLIALLRHGMDSVANVTFVFRMLTNKAVDIRREQSRAALNVHLPEDAAEINPELRRLLETACSRLPPDLKSFFQLRYREGLSQQEIGDRLGLCRGSVRWIERRFLKALGGLVGDGPLPEIWRSV